MHATFIQLPGIGIIDEAFHPVLLNFIDQHQILVPVIDGIISLIEVGKAQIRLFIPVEIFRLVIGIVDPLQPGTDYMLGVAHKGSRFIVHDAFVPGKVHDNLVFPLQIPGIGCVGIL
ncbi:hypothetical protein D3C75_785850 [compost metagenome]